MGWFVFLRWLCLGAPGSFEISAARCCCVTSQRKPFSHQRSPGSALRWKASLRCWFCDVTAFTKSWIRLDSLSQLSRPCASWRVMKGRSQRRVNKALAPCFKQSDLDPPTGGCSNQIVCVGRSPASHGFCGHAYVI